MRIVVRRAALLAGAAGVFVTAVSVGLRPRPTTATAPQVQRGGPYLPASTTREGAELALVFIGSSGCVPSNHKELPATVERLKRRLRDRAGDTGRGFSAVGIARDWNVDAGLEHLRKFGAFDEVMSGRNWMNAGVRRYMWEELPGEAVTPQVLVVERLVGDPSAARVQYGIRDERLVVRKVGADEIMEWARLGAPLPDLAPIATRPPVP